MTEKTTEKESKMGSDKWFWIGLMIWFIFVFSSFALHDMNENQCKVAAINKGMTASEVATACK